MSVIELSVAAERSTGGYVSAPEAVRATGGLLAGWEVRRLGARGQIGTLAVPGSKLKYRLADVLAIASAAQRPATAPK